MWAAERGAQAGACELLSGTGEGGGVAAAREEAVWQRAVAESKAVAERLGAAERGAQAGPLERWAGWVPGGSGRADLMGRSEGALHPRSTVRTSTRGDGSV